MADKKQKSNSLKTLGYTVEPQKGVTDKNGMEVLAVVFKPTFLKKTKRGLVKAYSSLDGAVETTVDGLYKFQQDGEDFIGQRMESATPKAEKSTVAA